MTERRYPPNLLARVVSFRVGDDGRVKLRSDCTVRGGMPDGYHELAYIESDGFTDDVCESTGIAPCVVVGKDGFRAEDVITWGLWEQLIPDAGRAKSTYGIPLESLEEVDPS